MDKSSIHQQPPVPLMPLVGIVAGFFLFLALVYVLYVGDRPETVASGSMLPEERYELLREKLETETKQLTTYGWVDREEGIVRLPIDRAMELTLQEINGGRRSD